MIIGLQGAKDIINSSITNAKQYQEKLRRDHIGKMLDYYSGKYTDQYIKKRFAAKVWQEVPIVNFNIPYSKELWEELIKYSAELEQWRKA